MRCSKPSGSSAASTARIGTYSFLISLSIARCTRDDRVSPPSSASCHSRFFEGGDSGIELDLATRFLGHAPDYGKSVNKEWVPQWGYSFPNIWLMNGLMCSSTEHRSKINWYIIRDLSTVPYVCLALSAAATPRRENF